MSLCSQSNCLPSGEFQVKAPFTLRTSIITKLLPTPISVESITICALENDCHGFKTYQTYIFVSEKINYTKQIIKYVKNRISLSWLRPQPNRWSGSLTQTWNRDLVWANPHHLLSHGSWSTCKIQEFNNLSTRPPHYLREKVMLCAAI